MAYASRIKTVEFSVLNSSDTRQITKYEVINGETTRDAGQPVIGGIYDLRMGTTTDEYLCETCYNRKALCPGHPGFMQLRYPVQNPLVLKEIFKWARITCRQCGYSVVNPPAGTPVAKRLSKAASMVGTKYGDNTCKHCGTIHWVVSREKELPTNILKALVANETGNVIEVRVFNHYLLEIFQRIPDAVLELFAKTYATSPVNMITDTLYIPPNTVRPNIKQVGGGGNRSNNNDITTMLKYIQKLNETLPANIPDLVSKELSMKYTVLDIYYYLMIVANSTTAKKIRLSAGTHAPDIQSIASRFPTKLGRIRQNLLGGRVFNISRAVISGDNSIAIDEVGIPLTIAQNIYIPEVVGPWNIAFLMQIYYNRDYPRIDRIYKRASKRTYSIHNIDQYVDMEYGDIAYRSLIDGDTVLFNRQPTLTESSICAHRAVILRKFDTLRLHLSATTFYNADFDGDAMNCIFIQGVLPRFEAAVLAAVSKLIISSKNGEVVIGATQDGLIGTFEFSRNRVKFEKYLAMQCFATIYTPQFEFSAKEYTSRDLVSGLLSNCPISFNGKPKYYVKAYEPYIQYDKNDVRNVIDHGVVKTGIMDKKIVGEGSALIYSIARQYGNHTALRFVYELQQIVERFMLLRGYTISIADLLLPRDAFQQFDDIANGKIAKSNATTEILDAGKLVPPLGMSVEEYYERIEIENLRIVADNYMQIILTRKDADTNNALKMSLSGSKGSLSNIMSMVGTIGQQTLEGGRIPQKFGYKRTYPYSRRYSTDPADRGFVSTSYIRGIQTVEEYLSLAQESRVSIIKRAMATSRTGYGERKSIKNLESVIVDHFYRSVKGTNIVQILYGGFGIDPKSYESVEIPDVLISNADFEQKYQANVNDFAPKFRNATLTQRLNSEFTVLARNREWYRTIYYNVHKATGSLDMGIAVIAVNIDRIIANIWNEYRELATSNDNPLNPIESLDYVTNFVHDLPYVYMNASCRARRIKIPQHFRRAVSIVQIVAQLYLCTRQLIERQISNAQLEIICTEIYTQYQRALVDPGYPIGIPAAQNLSEPMTQYVLDSHHRAGSGGTRTTPITRMEEILSARPTEKMLDPSMTLNVLPKYASDYAQVKRIANHLESLKLQQFVTKWQIFYERFGEPRYPQYLSERTDIARFIKHNLAKPPPSDLRPWVFRFEFDRRLMFEKSIKIETIVTRLQDIWEDIYIVYNPENADNLMMRVYVTSNGKTVKRLDKETEAETFARRLLDTIVRGTPGIYTTTIKQKNQYITREDGSIAMDNSQYYIETAGTNLIAMLQNPYIDRYTIKTNSIHEVAYVYGIEAARQLIIDQLKNTGLQKVLDCHYDLYADETTSTGMYTSIEKSGLADRERKNALLRLAYMFPVQVIEEAATLGIKSPVTGVSGNLVMGQAPELGVNYTDVIVDNDFIRLHTLSIETQLTA